MTEGDTPPVLPLGRLLPMQVRDVWPHEGRDFTPWLLDNADVLSQVLNMDLDLQAAEHRVGDFYLDLVGVDTATGEPTRRLRPWTSWPDSHVRRRDRPRQHRMGCAAVSRRTQSRNRLA